MNTNAFPTKGNLMLAKNSLTLAKQGYELMDKKRNILIRELMNLIEEAKTIQSEIDATFTEAYQALQQANIEVGIHSVQEIAKAIPAEDSVRIKTRSIMGTEIPLVSCEEEKKIPYYGFYNSSESVDAARESFLKVKELTVRSKCSPVHGGKLRLPSCNEYPQDAEACKRPEKYNDSILYDSRKGYQQRPRRKRT